LASIAHSLLGVAAIGSLACSDTTPLGGSRVAHEREPVEATGLGVFYGLAFAPAPSLATIAAQHPTASAADNVATLTRELAAQAEPEWASAAMTVPALTAVGGTPLFAPAPASNRIRYSCGVTLVSPSFAITAGHCVTDDSDLTALKLRLYRPTPALARNYVPALLSGTFPSYSQPQLSAADGYLYDEYDCTLLNRCSAGANSNCPESTNTDMALLHCSGRPGDKYGFVNVNRGGDPAGKEALMHWKHEVLDLGGPESSLPADRIAHYVTRTDDVSQNYHYFDQAADLLPLRSITWSDGTPTTFVASRAVDAHGCHGTSGSGLLVRVGTTPEYELVGPAVGSGPAFGTRLCEQVPNPGGSPSGPGTQALLGDGMDPNDLLSLHTAEIQADCRDRVVAERDVADLPFSAGSHETATIFSHLVCQIDAFGADGSVTADPVFGPYPEPFVEDASGTRHAIGGFTLEANADYRIGLETLPRASCTSGCGTLTFTVGTQSFVTTPNASAPSVVGATFAAAAAGPADVGVASTGALRAFGGFVLIREGQVNSFDTLEDRLEAALYALGSDRTPLAGPLPMRFTGDGTAGFEAELFPGERLALLRQAMAPGHAWTARVGSSSYSDLSCGLLDRAGAPFSTAPCADVLHLDDRSGSEARLGFYVELAPSSSRSSAEIRYVALASDAARDTDGDGVPEVLDNCPGDWNASQGACSEEPPPPGTGGSGGVSGGESGAGGEAGAVTSETGGTGTKATGEGGAEAGAAGEAANGTGGSGASGDTGGAGGSGVAGGVTALAGSSAQSQGGASGAPGVASGVGGGATGGVDGTGSGGTAGSSGASSAGASTNSDATSTPSNHAGCSCRVGAAPDATNPARLALLLAGLSMLARRTRRGSATRATS
jgi:MYXO-CTERM domain-containing protein